MPDEKKCRRCSDIKPVSEFRADARYSDGYGSWCVQCHRDRNSSWARENRKRLNAKSAEWREKNIDVARSSNRKHKQKNRDALAAKHAEWVKKNRSKRRATWAKRRAAKLAATPKWADHKRIAEIYKEAVAIQERTGVRMHVDHIIPLQHELVCGLHCENNLQILPGSSNESKRNRWEPGGIEAAYAQPRLFEEPVAKATQEALL